MLDTDRMKKIEEITAQIEAQWNDPLVLAQRLVELLARDTSEPLESGQSVRHIRT